MHVSEQGMALVRRFEGFSPVVTHSAFGHRVIGYGHIIQRKERFPEQGISRAQAEALLYDDVRARAAALQRNLRCTLPQHRMDALVSFTLPRGFAAFANSTLRAVIQRGWHEEAAEQMRAAVLINGVRNTPLVARRKAEADMYAGFEEA